MYPFEILLRLLIGKFCLTQKCVDVLNVLYYYNIVSTFRMIMCVVFFLPFIFADIIQPHKNLNMLKESP